MTTPAGVHEKEGSWLPEVVDYLIEQVHVYFKQLQDKVTKKKGIWKNIALALNNKV